MTEEQLKKAMEIRGYIMDLKKTKKRWEQATEIECIKLKFGNASEQIDVSQSFDDIETLKTIALERINDRIRDLTYQFESL